MSAGIVILLGVVLLVLVGLSALFSAIETALFSLQPFQIERLKASHPSLAGAIERLMQNPRRVLSAILLGDSLVNLPLIILSLFTLRELAPDILPFWASALVIFALIVFLCDLLPKLLGLGNAERVARLGVATLNLVMPVVDPVCRVLQDWSEKIADRLTPAKLQPHRHLSEEELETLVELSAEDGALAPAESEMIQEILKLGDKTAKDVMTPRVDVFGIADDLSVEQAIPLLKERRHRRVPVYGETPDDILGVLDVKAFLLDPSRHFTEVMDPPSFIPETMKALDLLRSFLTHKQGMAILVDEFGGTEGMVTLSDIVEEIVSDAVPSAERSLYIEPAGEGRLLVSGSARLDDLRELGVRFEAEGVDTIGGLIFNHLGDLPKPGATLTIDGVRLTVRRLARKRIEEVLIELPEHLPPAGGREDAP